MPKSQRSLRNLLINPAFQLRYIFWMSATGVALIGLYSTIFYLYMRENYAILVDLSPMDQSAKDQLYRELGEIIIKLGALSAVFLTVIAVFGLILSHRAAGPLFHFKKVFEAIRAGSVDARIHLRPKDDFQEVAQSFNQMMDKMVERKD